MHPRGVCVPVKFCGRGGEESDVFLCRTLTQSPTVPALSRREPWFERSVCMVCTRGVCGCCPSRTIPPSAFGSHLPLHKGGMVGSPFVRWVTVEFVDTVYFAKSICLTCLANQTRYAKAEPLLDISVLRRIRYVLPRAKRESDMGCRDKGVAYSVGDRIISRFCCFFGGSKPPPYRLGEKPFFRWVTVEFAGIDLFIR